MLQFRDVYAGDHVGSFSLHDDFAWLSDQRDGLCPIDYRFSLIAVDTSNDDSYFKF